MTLVGLYLGIYFAMLILGGHLVLAPQHWIYFLAIDNRVLLACGALEATMVEHGQIWRLTTATLLHGSLPHVALNGMALFQLGRLVERLFGGGVLIALHLGIGTLANVASLTTMAQLTSPPLQVGGSGALFGLLGFLTIAEWRSHLFDPPIGPQLLFWLLVGLGLGYWIGADNVAHLAGAGIGGTIGLFHAPLRREVLPRGLAAMLLCLATAGYAWAFSLVLLPWLPQ